MEAIQESGRARLLGVSNVTLEQLQELCHEARVQPRFVQNRCYAERGWDRDVRKFCAANGLVYQGFSLLDRQPQSAGRPELVRIAQRHGRTVSQIVFRFALDVGMVPLTGTTDAGHMRADFGKSSTSLWIPKKSSKSSSWDVEIVRSWLQWSRLIRRGNRPRRGSRSHYRPCEAAEPPARGRPTPRSRPTPERPP